MKKVFYVLIVLLLAAFSSSAFAEEIFFEDWESGSLATKNWIVSGAGNAWAITGTSYEGSYSAWAKKTNADSMIEKNISTANYENITFSFFYRVSAFNGNDYFWVDWYDGSSWNLLFNHTTATGGGYVFNSTDLNADANNNPNFKIRFGTNSDRNPEWVSIENIQVDGDFINITLNETAPPEIEMLWIDPDEAETDREQKQVLEIIDGKQGESLTFMDSVLQNIFSILLG
jgi:hypothetical protein